MDDFCELVSFQMTLVLTSECGDSITASSEKFVHNKAAPKDMIEALDHQHRQLKEQLIGYINRRLDRKEKHIEESVK